MVLRILALDLDVRAFCHVSCSDARYVVSSFSTTSANDFSKPALSPQPRGICIASLMPPMP